VQWVSLRLHNNRCIKAGGWRFKEGSNVYWKKHFTKNYTTAPINKFLLNSNLHFVHTIDSYFVSFCPATNKTSSKQSHSRISYSFPHLWATHSSSMSEWINDSWFWSFSDSLKNSYPHTTIITSAMEIYGKCSMISILACGSEFSMSLVL